MVALDIWPYSFMDGTGFKNLAGSLLSAGARFDNVNIEELLPAGPTITKHVGEPALNIRAELIPKIREHIELALGP